tara:strand:+ start:2494 stop:2670 length:177 start_codon:yes stop_codon:yes gene_type:complete
MKKYILTIKFNEETDEVEWLQEEVITYDDKVVITADNISAVTVDDLKEYYKDNKCVKH